MDLPVASEASTAALANHVLPDCWGHRGASAELPENTLASFQAAIRDGVEGIESDVHVTLDDVVVMFHDPNLLRTTGRQAVIRTSKWFGDDGIHLARTTKLPSQPIPTFEQTMQLMMEPGNRKVVLNVDVKIWNDPNRLFKLMHKTIVSHENWESTLAPRIILGLWHPKFNEPAMTHLPYLPRIHIGITPSLARMYFWDTCEGFSLPLFALLTKEGKRFRDACKKDDKTLMAWRVDSREEMMEATRMGVRVILTDHTRRWMELKDELIRDYPETEAQISRSFIWKDWKTYWISQRVFVRLQSSFLRKVAGPFDPNKKTWFGPLDWMFLMIFGIIGRIMQKKD